MDQGMLDVRQEMVRLNINMLEISEIKWTGIGTFNSNNNYIYYCGQEFLRRNAVSVTVNKSLICRKCNQAWLHYQKWQNNLSLYPKKAIQHHSNLSICPNYWWHRNWCWPFLERPTTLSRTNTKKSCPFHHRGLECKSRKSRDTWSNRQVWSWSTKWSRTNANRVLPRECTGHSKHPISTTQETTLHMDITRWLILKSDWLYSLQLKMEKLYTVSKSKIWSRLWLRSSALYCKIQAKIEENIENH